MTCEACTLNLFQDIGGFGGPDKRLGVLVVVVDVAFNRHDEFFYATECATAQAVLREVAEEFFSWNSKVTSVERAICFSVSSTILPACSTGF